MSRTLLAFVAVVILGALAGGLFAWVRMDGDIRVPPAETTLVGQPRPPFTLGDTHGRRVSAAEFDGGVLLINFWATWCTPCRKEMPMLVDIQNQFVGQGLQVVGIALDEVQQARDFARELEVSYTILVGAADVMAMGVMYGNRVGMLPYTVLVDRDGIIRWTHLGELGRDALLAQLSELGLEEPHTAGAGLE